MKFVFPIVAILCFTVLGCSMKGESNDPSPAVPDKIVDPLDDPELPALTEVEFAELQQALRTGDQEQIEAIGRRQKDRHHKHDQAVDPQPDQQPGEAETVVVPDPEIGPVEGREEREARHKRHLEEQKRKAEEKRLAEEEAARHPKPRPVATFFGTVLSFAFGVVTAPVSGILWAVSWILIFIKWGGMIALCFVVLGVVVMAVGFGLACWRLCSYVWSWVKGEGKSELPHQLAVHVEYTNHELLQLWRECERRILISGGQWTLNGRRFNRADLSDVRQMIAHFEKQIDRDRGSIVERIDT